MSAQAPVHAPRTVDPGVGGRITFHALPQPGRLLRIGLLAPVKLPLSPPFAGGLEAHTWQLAAGLADRGHDVTIFGPDAPPGVHLSQSVAWQPSDAGRSDVSSSPDAVLSEYHAHLQALRTLVTAGERFDVVHDNSGHHLPVAMAGLLPMPMTTTLHTPPNAWMESALRLGRADLAGLVTVSRHTARAWQRLTQVDDVIANGVDLQQWKPGFEHRHGAVWLGRIVPEKAPHLAIEGARQAGMAMRLAGPIHDRRYFESEVAPRLGDGISYEGHLDSGAAAALVAEAAVTVVTPMWDEPFGQVVTESLACGTPVAGFAIGALPEITDETVAVLVPPGHCDALANAMTRAATLSASACRSWVCNHYSIDRMLDHYEEFFQTRVRAARSAP